uniref:Uncharacterized protein n=1 Tax=Oryza brachyantha TaxID=4533 RepID=J3M4U5_ORYBR
MSITLAIIQNITNVLTYDLRLVYLIIHATHRLDTSLSNFLFFIVLSSHSLSFSMWGH